LASSTWAGLRCQVLFSPMRQALHVISPCFWSDTQSSCSTSRKNTGPWRRGLHSIDTYLYYKSKAQAKFHISLISQRLKPTDLKYFVEYSLSLSAHFTTVDKPVTCTTTPTSISTTTTTTAPRRFVETIKRPHTAPRSQTPRLARDTYIHTYIHIYRLGLHLLLLFSSLLFSLFVCLFVCLFVWFGSGRVARCSTVGEDSAALSLSLSLSFSLFLSETCSIDR